MSKKVMLEETITEKIIKLLGHTAVVHTLELGEACAWYGIPVAIRPEKDRGRRLHLWDPFGSEMWYVPIVLIMDIESRN